MNRAALITDARWYIYCRRQAVIEAREHLMAILDREEAKLNAAERVIDAATRDEVA